MSEIKKAEKILRDKGYSVTPPLVEIRHISIGGSMSEGHYLHLVLSHKFPDDNIALKEEIKKAVEPLLNKYILPKPDEAEDE